MIDFSSGVRYRWCGSLPVGMRSVSTQRDGSITLIVASRELSTKTGGKGWGTGLGAGGTTDTGGAAAAPLDATQANPINARAARRCRNELITNHHFLKCVQCIFRLARFQPTTSSL
ncbi:hypothetical protein D3C72_2246170 [compost metagenome]